VKFLIVNNEYRAFLDWLYQVHQGLEKRPYEEQIRVRIESCFGLADFYSHNLKKLGHDAYDVFVNSEFAQKAWAKKHDLRYSQSRTTRWLSTLQKKRQRASKTPFRLLKPLFYPFLRMLDQKGSASRESWFYEILSAQVQQIKPDVLINLTMETVTGSFLKEIKPFVKLIVGQHAAPLPKDNDFGAYDLILSSLPNQVAFFRSLGVKTEPFRLGFEPRVLDRLKTTERELPVTFVGTISSDHEARIALLESLCQHNLSLLVWGNMVKRVSSKSPLHKCFKGMAWGMDMYQILHDSMITLNHHIGVSQSYANNMRLYEATGVGALLLTDWKENLPELFEPGKEVVVYRNREECLEAVRYYFEHEAERKSIASMGQKRTLRDHTYDRRMR